MDDLNRIADALERIAAVLEGTSAQSAAAPEPEPCQHPAEQRIEFGGMGESEGFQCKACGEHVAPVALATGAAV